MKSVFLLNKILRQPPVFLGLKVIVPSVTISVIITSAGTKSAALLFSAALKAPVSAVTKAQVSAVTKAPVSAGAKAPALKRRH